VYCARYETPAGEVLQTALELSAPARSRSAEWSTFCELVGNLARDTLAAEGVTLVVSRRVPSNRDCVHLLLAAPGPQEMALRKLALSWNRINEVLAGVCRLMRDASEYTRSIGAVVGRGIEVRNDPEERDGVLFHPSVRLLERFDQLAMLVGRQAETASVCWRFRRVDPGDAKRQIKLNLVRLNRSWIPERIRQQQEDLAARFAETGLLAEQFVVLESAETQALVLSDIENAFLNDPEGQGFSTSPAIGLDELALELLGPETSATITKEHIVRLGNTSTVAQVTQAACEVLASPPTVSTGNGRRSHPLKVFVSYAHEDRKFAERLHVSSVMLRREGAIELWSDNEIQPGSEWRRDIDRALQAAEVVLLLISPDFMQSEFCYSVELRRALERHQSGGVVVVPIYVRWTDVGDAGFEALQALPSGRRPITSWPDQDEAWLDIISGLRRVLSSEVVGASGGDV